MKEYLFSYGTLQKPEVQMDLFGRLLNGTRDKLIGYKSVSIEITDKDFLATGADKIQRTLVATNNENDTIRGMVLEVSGEELLLSDKYEPVGYERISVETESGKSVWIYVADKTS
jgi:gamma-glutamylcyclotransferase (GGCT)/AIG2-like uncharacterized protein YtfP